MFDFLGKIPQEIYIACSGNKNSMAMLEFLSRTDRKIIILHIDFKDEDSKERVEFIKKAGKLYKIQVEIIKPIAKKENEYPDYYRNKEINRILQTYYPHYVLTAHNLEDAIVEYIINSIKCNPRTIQYRNKNIIRPYINTSQEEFEYWVKSKKVGYFEPIKKKIPGQCEFVAKHILDNCYKINPNLSEDVLSIIKADFNSFMENRKKIG